MVYNKTSMPRNYNHRVSYNLLSVPESIFSIISQRVVSLRVMSENDCAESPPPVFWSVVEHSFVIKNEMKC